MKRLLIIQHTISHYNIPLYEELNNKYEVTVLHSDEKCVGKQYAFQTLYVPVFTAHYKFHKKNIIRIASRYDVVICMFHFAYPYFRLLGKKHRKYKLIYWGIGVTASANERFDSNAKYADSMLKGIRRSDACIFYSEYPREKYAAMGASKDKMFVANNTVAVNRIAPDHERTQLLFVGTLNANKKIGVLLEQYLQAYRKNANVPELAIIGDGPERERTEAFIAQNGLESRVHLCGEILDENILEQYYARAVLCISPDQAGLSVLKSMGYGVPFVTHRNAITGGEIFNIEDGKTGFLIDDFDRISELIEDVVVRPEYYRQVGLDAYEHYWKCCKISDMAQCFAEAIEFSLKSM